MIAFAKKWLLAGLLYGMVSSGSLPTHLLAQVGPPGPPSPWVSLPEARVRTSADVNGLFFVRLAPLTLPGDDRRDRVEAFLNTYGAALGYLPPDHTLLYTGAQRDVAGGHHLHYRQLWRGLPVEGGELRFHFDASDRLTALNGFILPSPDLSLSARLTEESAFLLAQRYFRQYLKSNTLPALTAEPQLLIFRTGLARRVPGLPHLAYAFSLRDESGHGARLYVDAHTGRLLDQQPTTHTVLDRRLYKRNPSPMNLLWSEGDPFPGEDLTSSQQEIVTVTGQFYNFLRYTFDRDGYDGNGATMKAVSNPASISCQSKPNANWNGNSINLCTSLVTDDVIAHEWAHALTEYTSGQVYQYQPGALNESFSDILGEVVDLINDYGDDTGAEILRGGCDDTGTRWRIAEENTAFPTYLRDMWDPTCREDPGKVSDPEYQCGETDDGGVHSNSGVNNHAFALLVDGGSYNGVTVAPIGLTKATHLFYLAHTAYLTRYADFTDQADALEAAAAQLQQTAADLPALTVGETTTASGEHFTPADVVAVAAAIAAVELRSDPACPDWAPLLASATPPVCESGPPTVLFSEDFESGAPGWTTTELPANPTTWNSRAWTLSSDLPDNRPGQAYYGASPYDLGNCIDDLDNGILRLASPALVAATDAVLSFDHSVSLEREYDGGRLYYTVNDGSWIAVPAAAFSFNGYNAPLAGDFTAAANPYQGEMAFTGADEGGFSGNWGTTFVELSELEVQTGDAVRFAWDLATDGCNGWLGWWIDNVMLLSCSAALPVEWLAFSAFAEREGIALNWATAQEQDNHGFTVQRLVEGSSSGEWTDLGWVPARGTARERTDYRFLDATAPGGVWCYYRLRQEDFDGTTAFSTVVKARLDQDPTDWRIFPNPVVGPYLHFRAPNAASGPVAAVIYDVTGRIVSRQTIANGRIEVGSLPPGAYYLSLVVADAPPVVKRFLR